MPMYRDRYGLSRAAGRAVSVISQFQPLQASEVAQRSSSDAPSIARAIGLLESKGFVKRDADPDDGRKVRLTLTSRGEDAVAEIDRVADAFETIVTSGLSKGEITIFFEILDKIEVNLEALRTRYDWTNITKAPAADFDGMGSGTGPVDDP